MAKCPACGKIWYCSKEGVSIYYEEDDSDESGKEHAHCTICRCPECRKQNKVIENGSEL